MKRRDFLAAAGVAGLAPLGSMAAAQTASGAGKELYELRLYVIETPEKQKLMEEFFRDAAIPALNRIGIKPVGVFKPSEGDRNDLFVLVPHQSADSVVTMLAQMAGDEEFLQAGEAVLAAPPKDPAYTRIESSLLLAFDGIPKLEVPTKKDTRVLQLRIYESHSYEKALKKIEMFNTGGELALFRKVGMPPVFFGQTLIGAKLPNLTYMLAFDDEEAKEKGWAAFIKSPEWDTLKRDPQYADTVSNITNIMLRPAAGSQI